MNKSYFALFCFFLSSFAYALPPDGMVYQLKASVVKIRVILPNGGYGVGSGVVVAKDQVATNCHVIQNAAAINVIKFGDSYRASTLKADWQHDLCILRFDYLETTAVQLSPSKDLQYEQSVFTISFPNNAPKPLAVYGAVKALYPFDNSVIIRSSTDFRLGASGGPMFTDEGKLVGLITLKTPGRNAFYYNIPADWISALLKQPEVELPAVGALPFWDAPEEELPYFMRVVQPQMKNDWQSLLKIATQWVEKEPETLEAWYTLGLAEFMLKDTQNANTHLGKVYRQNARHTSALMYLALIAVQQGNKEDALQKANLLSTLDADAAAQVKTALGVQ